MSNQCVFSDLFTDNNSKNFLLKLMRKLNSRVFFLIPKGKMLQRD